VEVRQSLADLRVSNYACVTHSCQLGMSSPHSEEAGSSGQADAPKVAAGAEAASSDDMVGIAQPDIQHQQETWVKYTSLQEGEFCSSALLHRAQLLILAYTYIPNQLHLQPYCIYC